LLRDARHNAGGTTPPLRKRFLQQCLKQMLRLPFRFLLLRAQTLKLLDDAREFLLALQLIIPLAKDKGC
jgi:hypothetical protein